MENIGTELMFQLPEEGVKSGEFARLFSNLDQDLDELGISSYGISDTSLEEVRRFESSVYLAAFDSQIRILY